MILVLIFGIGSSFAADSNQTDDMQTMNDDTAVSIDDAQTVSSTKNTNDSDDKILLESTENEKLSESTGSFTDLDKTIRSSEDELILDQDYAFSDGDAGLKISGNNFVLDFNGHTIDANNYEGTVMEITGSHVTLKNLKFINGKESNGNYPIKWSGNDGVLNNIVMSDSSNGIQWAGNDGLLTNSKFSKITSYVFSATGENVKFTYSEVKDMTCTYIMSTSNAIISHVKFDNITTTATGNYFAFTLPNTEISYCNFSNCVFAIGIGGAACNASHLLFDNVVANNYRGIIMFASGSIGSNLEFSTFKNCQAKNSEGNGRIVFLNNPSLKMTNCTFDGIHDTRYGISSASATITNCVFKNGNYVTYGAIVSERIDGSLIQNCKFINNTAPNGAAIYGTYVFVVQDCEFRDNVATSNGGAIYISKAKTTISSSTFNNNNAILGNDIYASKGLNIKLNGTGNVWSTSYNDDVYAPNAYDEMYTYLYVSQDGAGTGVSSIDPTNFDNALNKITLYGTIEFINNNQVYSISKTINSPVNLKGNGITITTAGNVFTFGTCSNMYIKGIKFVNCGSTSVNAPIVYTGYGVTISDCEFENCQGKMAGVFHVNFNSGTVAIADVKFDNCKFIGNTATQNNAYNSGAISLASVGTNTISNCEFISNSGVYAGAINFYGHASNYNIENCKFTGNTASNSVSGGAIYVAISSTTINNCQFDENSAPNGAVYVASNSFTLMNSNFTKNTATTGNGGALCLRNSAVTPITNSIFTSNSATSGNGGAIYATAGVNIIESEFSKNYANSANGGAIYLNNGADNSNINSTEFNENNAIDGGAIYTIVKADIMYSNFTKNTATGNGGAIFLTVSSPIVEDEFQNNQAVNGGAIYTSTDVTIDDSKFSNNIATSGDGGAVYGHKLTVDDSEFLNNNAASGNGGALYILDESSVRKTTLKGNNAVDGGAVYVNADNCLILTSILQNNVASNLGGAIYITDDCSYYVDTESQQSYSGNSAKTVVTYNIYNLHAKALIGEVYIIQDPNSISGNNFDGSRNNPVNITVGLSKVAPGGKLIFINASEIYVAVSGQNDIITTNKQGIKIYGNVTRMEGFKFVANENGLEIHNFILTGCDDAVFTCYGSECVIDNCVFMENGGVNCANASAVRMLGDNLTISNSRFIDNTVGESNTELGGAVFVNASNLNINNCTFDGNVANYGAHLFVCENIVGIYIYNSSFLNANAVNFDGVGILLKNSEKITISGNNFTDNVYGGALRFDSEVIGITISNNKFINNIAQSTGHAVNGGAISISRSVNSLIESNSFERNRATNFGGALYINGGDLKIIKNSFKQNNANMGGAVYSNAKLTITRSNFTSNSAVNGGAIYSNAAVIISGSNFKSNSATGTGGAIYVTASESSIVDSTFSGNTANSYRNVYASDVPTFTGNTIDASYSINSISDATYPVSIVVKGTFEDGNNFATDVPILANGEEVTSFSLTNSNSFSVDWNDILPNNYNVVVANVDNNNNNYVYFSSTPRSFAVNRRNIIYVSNTTNPGYGISAEDPTTWDNAVNLIADDGEIIFADGTYIDFYGKTINKGWTLTGSGNVILDANNKGRIFTVSANNVKIEGLTLQNGKVTSDSGGAIYNTGTGLTIDNVKFYGNTAPSSNIIGSTNTVTVTNSVLEKGLTISNADINYGVSKTITGSFINTHPASVTLKLNNNIQQTATVSNNLQFSATFSNLAVGSYVVSCMKNLINWRLL